MKPILYFTKINNLFSPIKFDQLIYSEDGINLNYKNSEIRQISYADVDHIYIKRYSLHPIIELTCIATPFIFTFLIMQYNSSDFLTLVSILTIPLVVARVINCKWYRMQVLLKDGAFFSKKVSNYVKAEQVSLLEKVCGKILYYNSTSLASA